MRLGIIGCGDVSGYTALLCRLNRRISLEWCADVDEARARGFARRHRVKRSTADYREMLGGGGVDAVYVAVPHHLHAPIIRDAAAVGVHVLCEKPIAHTSASAAEAIAAADAAGIRLAVNYQYRYDSGCYALYRAAREGALGRLLYGRCNVPWHRDESYFTGSAWHAQKDAAGGGTLITQGSHALDILLWAFGADAVRAQGVTRRFLHGDVEVEDFAAGIIELENGSVIEVTSSMAASPEQPVRIELYGTAGTALYRGPAFPRTRFRGCRPPRVRPPVPGIHAMARSIEGFRRWVEGGTPHLCDGREALRVLRAVEGIYGGSNE